MSASKKSRKKPTHPAIQRAYELGCKKGFRTKCRECQDKLLRGLQITNSHLWKILTDLDREQPIEGIVISFAMADVIIKALRKGEKRVKYANALRRQIKASDKTLHLLLAELELLPDKKCPSNRRP